MNSDELWETTMAREKRTLLCVIISDDMNDLEQADLDADRIFRLLMRDKVEVRRRFIEDNAANVKNLDVGRCERDRATNPGCKFAHRAGCAPPGSPVSGLEERMAQKFDYVGVSS